MNVTELLRNFHGLLKACHPFLTRAAVTIGDDEWDDFVELTFQITVGCPVEQHHGRRIVWRYGTWGTPTCREVQIYVTALTEDMILVGKKTSIDGGRITEQYTEERYPNIPVRFAFREFSHPLMDTEGSIWLDYVFGETTRESQILPVGTRICAPLGVCEFDLAG